jgi:hypothetical protein
MGLNFVYMAKKIRSDVVVHTIAIYTCRLPLACIQRHKFVLTYIYVDIRPNRNRTFYISPTWTRTLTCVSLTCEMSLISFENDRKLHFISLAKRDFRSLYHRCGVCTDCGKRALIGTKQNSTWLRPWYDDAVRYFISFFLIFTLYTG